MKIRSTKTIAEALHESTKGKTGANLTLAISNVVEFMDKNNLLGKSKEILAHLQIIIDKEEHVLRAKVNVAEPLTKKMTDELEESLKKRYGAKEVELEITEDINLISGLKVEVNDEVIDLTLSHRLHQLQTHLIKN
jgi:F-type H+-transporting ATPase subunit delta